MAQPNPFNETNKNSSFASSQRLWQGGALIFCILAFTWTASAASHPNVLIFLMDDLGRSDLGVDGSTFHETPRLDALARSGIRFTDFYSAHPVCSPTRAALMTGKVPQRLGITDWIAPGTGVALPAAETTLGEAFRSQGYQTAYLGKWHLGESDEDHPTKHGFEWTRGVNRAGQPASYHFPYRRSATTNSVWDVPDFEKGRPGDYLTDALTTRAIEFLNQRDRQRPFLLCLGHYAVHTPIQPPEGLAAKYREKRARQYGDSPTPSRPAPFDAVSRARQDDPDYAAMVENLDANIGRVVDALEKLGLRDNTIIVFTSDNGGLCTLPKGRLAPTSNLPWRGGKGWHYEGGIRVPAFIVWPARLKPATLAIPAITCDLYPTLLDLCGLPLRRDQHIDGRSLASALQGKSDRALNDRFLAWIYPHNHGSGHQASAALRSKDWKLIHYFASNRTELYHLGTDPGENTDLARQNSKQAAELYAKLQAWLREINARSPSSPQPGNPPGRLKSDQLR
ncbi:MAG TPA: sulfatase [Candidatus Paceibacterota bacterium]|nr:sulfatase [Verrucomicrobiota bacterium]HRY49534.1 sulfatase [Candidatus Paceibacterota bacterium]HSA00735.1 sulfatase [Candidatus Paceibacterota bacterium]